MIINIIDIDQKENITITDSAFDFESKYRDNLNSIVLSNKKQESIIYHLTFNQLKGYIYQAFLEEKNEITVIINKEYKYEELLSFINKYIINSEIR